MPLALAVLLVVLGVAAVVAALGYLIDKSAAARGVAGSVATGNGDSGVSQHT